MVTKVERREATQVAHEERQNAVVGESPRTLGFVRKRLGGQHRLLLLSDGTRVRDFGDRLEVLIGAPPLLDALATLIAETKQWSTVHLDGPDSMRQAAWHSLSAAGIHVIVDETSAEVAARLRQEPTTKHPSPTAAPEWDSSSLDCQSESPAPP